MQNIRREQEPSKLPTTPKEGAQIALSSVCEEVGQTLVAIDISSQLMLDDIPEDHPLRLQIKALADKARRGLMIVKKYRDAGYSGQFGFDVDSSGDPCLDIHPYSSTSLSKPPTEIG